MARPQKDLDLHKLEVFYWVAELGRRSFEAAQRLSLRQPTDQRAYSRSGKEHRRKTIFTELRVKV